MHTCGGLCGDPTFFDVEVDKEIKALTPSRGPTSLIMIILTSLIDDVMIYS